MVVGEATGGSGNLEKKGEFGQHVFFEKKMWLHQKILDFSSYCSTLCFSLFWKF